MKQNRYLLSPTLPSNIADVVNSLICKKGLDLLNHPGVATQNTLYHLTNMQYAGSSTWNLGHNQDFDNYFSDLSAITPASYPANLRGYPKNCYRIAVSQGNANGIGQLLSNDVKLISNESPTNWCLSPWGTVFGVGQSLAVKATPYRNAKARVLSSWNGNAFTCKLGTSFRTVIYSWHVNIGHWKYHDNNHVNDLIHGAYRSYDDAPGSTLPSHVIIGSKLPLSSNNLAVAAINFCNYIDWNPNLHGFSPTVSGLDIHSPGLNALPRYPELSLIPGNVSGGLNLMKQNSYNNILTSSPNSDFGYPHLTFSSNHYDYTPFDAIWANNREDANYDKNTIHVEDPNPHIGNFLVEEIAPTTLYLSNRTITGEQYYCGSTLVNEKYYADFEARNSVLAGNQSIYQHDPNPNNWYSRQRTASGDFVIDNNAVVTMRANNANGTSSLTLAAGFSAKAGSIFRAYVFTDLNMCGSFGQRMAANESLAISPNKEARPIQSKRASSQYIGKVGNSKNGAIIALYPNPTAGGVFYQLKSEQNFNFVITDAIGRELEKGNLNEVNGKLDLSQYKAGIYFITLVSQNFKQTDRIVLQ